MFSFSHRNASVAWRTGCVALVYILWAAALPCFASALTFDEALHLAQKRSRQLPAQEAATNASRQMAVAAGQRPDPTLKAGVNNLPVNGPDRLSLTRDFMTMRSVGMSQEFSRDSKLKARTALFPIMWGAGTGSESHATHCCADGGRHDHCAAAVDVRDPRHLFLMRRKSEPSTSLWALWSSRREAA